MSKLTITIGENKGKSHTFDTEAVMGRSPDVQLVLNDLHSSRKHARVVKINGEFFLEDMGSQNGTFLNGHRIKEPEKIKNNDRIRIGSTWINFITEEESLVPGEYFLTYKIIKEVAQETSGNIYLAEQSALQKNVLLWVLPQESFKDQASQAEENFFKQISTVASLFHPNIMLLMDFAVTSQYFYCAFEEVDFTSNIKNYLKEHHPLSSEEVLEIALQVAQGLSYAHGQNICHLHLSSKNVLIQHGHKTRVVLTELGVSQFLSDTPTGAANTTTSFLGTSEYISPEQISGKVSNGIAADIYSYGCLLYHLLSGVPPFEANNMTELAMMHVEQQPRPLNEIRKDISPELVNLIQRCMQKDQANRYAAFEEIIKELRRLQQQQDFLKMLQSDVGRALIEKTLGKTTLKKWWFILPLLAILLGCLTFFLLPLLF